MKVFCRLFPLVLAWAMTATSVGAQPSAGLFVGVGASVGAAALQQGPPASSAVVSRQPVAMRLEQVFASDNTPAPVIHLNVGDFDWVARFERVDVDITGFRSWVGAIEGIRYSHVVITERAGIVSGLINAVDVTYQIRTASPGVYFLEQVDTRRAGRELEPLPGIATFGPPREAVAADDGTTIDVLILFTPAAQTKAGGGSQLAAIASQIISDTNTIFGNSGISTQVRLVGSSLFNLTEAAAINTDLSALANSSTAQAMRDAFGADLVQLLVDSNDPSLAGVAYLFQNPGATDFNAYSVADLDYTFQYTPTHEMGHNMGSNHAPEDGVTGGLFSYSLGYKDAANGFRTVMAYDCPSPGCPRAPHMSSQTTEYQNHPTGSATQNNALSINTAAFTISNWRQSLTGTNSPPSAPSNLRTLVSGSSVAFMWNSGPGATAYTLQVGSAPGLTDVFDGSVGNVISMNLSLAVGTYYWRVIATNSVGSASSGESQVSVTTSCGVPTTPTSLNASVSGEHVFLTWTPPALGNVTTYVVQAGSSTGGSDLFNGPVGPHPIVSAYVPDGFYFVRVRAQNACGTSAASNEVFLNVGTSGGGGGGGVGTPAAPQDLRLSLTTTHVTASWNLGPGSLAPTAFIIEAGSAPGLADLAVIEVPGQTRSFTTTRPWPGVYYVRVRARNGLLYGPATADLMLQVP